MAHHWDGFHMPRPYRAFGYDREHFWFQQDWDVESTIWFNPSQALTRLGQVPIKKLTDVEDE